MKNQGSFPESIVTRICESGLATLASDALRKRLGRYVSSMCLGQVSKFDTQSDSWVREVFLARPASLPPLGVLSFSQLATASQLLSFVVPILFRLPGRFGGRLVRPVQPELLDYFALIL